MRNHKGKSGTANVSLCQGQGGAGSVDPPVNRRIHAPGAALALTQ